METRQTLGGFAEFRVDDGADFPIVGYAAVFDSLSENLGGFKERINRRAFDRALSEGQDVRALIDHDASKIIGRTKSGTLRLTADNHGLRVAIRPPDTNTGRDLVTSIRRGDIDQMSFAFRAIKDDWPDGVRGTPEKPAVRELLDVDLYDVSAVTYPAYEQTSIDARCREGVRGAALLKLWLARRAKLV